MIASTSLSAGQPASARRLDEGLYVIDIALPMPSPTSSQVYLVESSEGWVMVDAGWDSGSAWAELAAGLGSIGITPRDIRYVLLSHAHPDHVGLVGRLAEASDATFVLHPLEYARALDYASGKESFAGTMNAFLALADAPAALMYPEDDSCPVPQVAAVPRQRYQLMQGGEVIRVGGREFEVLWTPGHSCGHLAFFERTGRFLFTGDALLGQMAPNVEFGIRCGSDPMAATLRTLGTLGGICATHTLSAHGGAIADVQASTHKLQGHFYKRLMEAFRVCEDLLTCYECLGRVNWRFPADDMEHPGKSRVVVFQMLSYLETLAARGFLTRYLVNGFYAYEWSDLMRDRDGQLSLDELIDAIGARKVDLEACKLH